MDKIDLSQFDVSNFDPNAILRGAQLTLVGGKACPSRYRHDSSILTRPDSQSGSPEPGSLHLGPLPPSCYCCSCRHRYPCHRRHTRTLRLLHQASKHGH
ncbi:hypothetical protein IG631_09826 [Alternaria alternata]|nr:hypothetical protein IG631_09826 [Alternaria alternata]